MLSCAAASLKLNSGAPCRAPLAACRKHRDAQPMAAAAGQFQAGSRTFAKLAGCCSTGSACHAMAAVACNIQANRLFVRCNYFPTGQPRSWASTTKPCNQECAVHFLSTQLLIVRSVAHQCSTGCCFKLFLLHQTDQSHSTCKAPDWGSHSMLGGACKLYSLSRTNRLLAAACLLTYFT
jgi:hypothetical protein